ncbi:hypothetical protein [Accumulibacter sp.]|uniref:hypothetical protein n=1 Tax=Accumulibacter sp. TaxID=2053492 RepID=UPI0028C48CF6|nr:hypothetical protein [Accumulibacter sp.]
MYIVAIGWLYVTILMALTETSVVAGVLTLLFYGLLPTALLLWLFGGPARRRRARMAAEASARGGLGPGTEEKKPDC